MRKLDAHLRTTPDREKAWRKAFNKARQGWRALSWARDNLRYGWGAWASQLQEEAEEKLTEALQILANAGLEGELAEEIRKSLQKLEARRVAV